MNAAEFIRCLAPDLADEWRRALLNPFQPDERKAEIVHVLLTLENGELPSDEQISAVVAQVRAYADTLDPSDRI